jgi:hypothetical protein
MLNKPSGLSPVKYLGGSDWDGKVNQYYIAAADTNAFYIGDLVRLNQTADATRGIRGITLGTAGDPAVGVVVAIGTNPEGGPYINPADLTKTFRPSGAAAVPYYVAVVDDPNVIFEIQEDGDGGTIASTDSMDNANIVYAAPATGVLVSGTMVDSSSVADTSTLNLKLLGLARKYEQGVLNTFGLYAKWLCMINNHQYRTGITGPAA